MKKMLKNKKNLLYDFALLSTSFFYYYQSKINTCFVQSFTSAKSEDLRHKRGTWKSKFSTSNMIWTFFISSRRDSSNGPACFSGYFAADVSSAKC